MAELGLPRILRWRRGLHRGMAGARGRFAAGSGHRGTAGDCGRRAARSAPFTHAFRRSLALSLALSAAVTAMHAQVLSGRIWPARDYTRLTLESREEIKYTVFSVKDPERLVLELETPELSSALAELNAKVSADDPYVQG